MSDVNQAPTTEPTDWSGILGNQFGQGYVGERKEVTQEAPVETPEAPEVTQEAATPSPEVKEEVEEVPISSIEQLIELNEYDPEWFNSLEVPVKVNGETSKAKLADLRNSYQIQQAAEQRLNEAKEKAKAETTALAQKREKLDAEFNAVAVLVQEAEQVLSADYSKVNWEKMRVEDPAEFSAKQLEFGQRQARINELKQKAVAQYQAHSKNVSSESEDEKQARLIQEAGRLTEKIPEWKSEETAKAERQQIGAYLLENGFSKEELSNIYDHRLVLLARQAMLYAKGQNKAEVAKKKVLTVPKVLKPGAPTTKEQAAKDSEKAKRDRLKKTGRLEDLVALL